MKKVFAALLLALLAAPASAHEIKIGDLVITHPWARATPGDAPNGGVFLKIENHGQADDRLIGAATDVAAKAEIHEHVMDNGVAKMRQVESIDLTAHATTELKPGGLHVMLIDLTKPLREHDTFSLTLTFEHAGSIEVEVHIEKAGATGPSG
jgi:copper(I)-binding protein